MSREKSQEKSWEKSRGKMSMQEKRQNKGKTSEEIENWKCNLVALNGLPTVLQV